MDRFRATTPEALDLLSQMLKLCPKKRINVDKALEHPFFPKAMGTLFDASKIRTAPGRISLGFESLDIANGHVKPSQRNVLSAQLRVHFLLQVSKFRPVSIPPQLVEQIPEGARFVSRARTEMENSSQVGIWNLLYYRPPILRTGVKSRWGSVVGGKFWGGKKS